MPQIHPTREGESNSLKQLSCAQAASEAARRGLMAGSMTASSRQSNRQVTKSMEGRDKIVRSDSISWGAAAGMMGYTVSNHPQPLTEPSLVNFHRSSSPGMRSSWDQSDHSRPLQGNENRFHISCYCLTKTYLCL